MDVTTMPVRRVARSEVAACVTLAADRGWSPEERKWGLLLDVGTCYAFDDPDGGLAGMVTLTPYGGTLAAVGMMVVANRFGGRGLGRALMERAIADSGDALVTLYATETGRPLYEKLGLQVVETSWTVLGTWSGHPDDVAGTRPVAPGDWPAIRSLDHAVFGADRGVVLDRLLAFTDEIRVVKQAGRVVGYAGRWQNGGTAMIGPVVAPDPATAARLVSALACGTRGDVRLDVEERHAELLTHLRSNGLEQVRSTSVMTMSSVPLPGDAARRFAPLTVATG